ncbi:MAG: type IV secretion system protein, partial [Rickettsiales bacterium]|nr:type IV secretion system protein [Rickettsiales bacterium]
VIEEWIQPDDYDDIDYAPFIDKSCINFVGSSHNTIGYKSYDGYHKLFNQYKSFTAPIAECVTETLKNFLYNRAGYTKCSTGGFPDVFGNCTYGFEFQKGDNLLEVKDIVDPISRLLGYIDVLLKLTLTLMIVLYGYNILITGGKLDKKDLILMIVKVAIVLSFASSAWWRNQLFNFVYGFSESFSNITSKLAFDDTVDANLDLIKYDGCYFGDMNDILGKEVGEEAPNVEENNYYNYPSSRQYVAIFDSLDCKISKYLGYSVGKSLPNLLYVIALSIIWPFNIGIFLAVASLMMLLFVISFALRTVYIFIAASIGLALMLYVSPIIIPCILFKSRKKMFDTWVKNTISYALQPLFLFAFVSISLIIMDSYVLGEGIFVGAGPQRELVCGYVCKGTDSGDVVSYGDDILEANCGDDETLIETKTKSVLCLLEKATATPFTVFNSVGIFISLLSGLQLSDLIMFLRIAFLFFILNNVLKTIPSIASNITGTNSNLPGLSEKSDPFAMASKIKDIGSIAQRIFKYTGISAGKTALDKIKKLTNKKSKSKDE